MGATLLDNGDPQVFRFDSKGCIQEELFPRYYGVFKVLYEQRVKNKDRVAILFF